MDQMLLLVLSLAVAIGVATLALSRSRRNTALRAAGPADAPLAVSTEGMKVCPRCGMGNLWTERTCSACGNTLKG
jgi:hypothetical protein